MTMTSSRAPRRYISVRAGSYPPAVLQHQVREPADPIAKEISVVPVEARLLEQTAPEATGTAWSLPVLESLAADPAPQQWGDAAKRDRGVLRTILGAVAGGVIGLFAALLLLALSDPTERLPMLSRPIELWNYVDDFWVRVSALIVAAGFVLLGAVLARYRRSS
ncbi:MAG: hypothetical protein U0V87_10260 [Acidobacteriota bacterium]